MAAAAAAITYTCKLLAWLLAKLVFAVDDWDELELDEVELEVVAIIEMSQVIFRSVRKKTYFDYSNYMYHSYGLATKHMHSQTLY